MKRMYLRNVPPLIQLMCLGMQVSRLHSTYVHRISTPPSSGLEVPFPSFLCCRTQRRVCCPFILVRFDDQCLNWSHRSLLFDGTLSCHRAFLLLFVCLILFDGGGMYLRVYWFVLSWSGTFHTSLCRVVSVDRSSLTITCTTRDVGPSTLGDTRGVLTQTNGTTRFFTSVDFKTDESVKRHTHTHIICFT